jgi:hypothetical protein
LLDNVSRLGETRSDAQFTQSASPTDGFGEIGIFGQPVAPTSKFGGGDNGPAQPRITPAPSMYLVCPP